jgi:hypothetical protein
MRILKTQSEERKEIRKRREYTRTSGASPFGSSCLSPKLLAENLQGTKTPLLIPSASCSASFFCKIEGDCDICQIRNYPRRQKKERKK